MHSLTALSANPIQDMDLSIINLKFLASILLFLTLSSVVVLGDTAPTGTIKRTTKQQILASIPPSSEENSQLFLSSPSGKYTAFFLRRATTLGAGGFGNDFCYIQVQDSSTEESMWESECAPVSTVNTCSLVLSGNGLEIFDGSRSEWDTEADSEDPVESLELVDDGDMRIRDDQGELVWKASSEPRANQRCGAPGSPGLAPAMPPFASPIGHGRNQPFGQPGSQLQPSAAFGQQQPLSEADQGGVGNGFSGQPLVDNTPYNGGCFRRAGSSLAFGVSLLLVGGLFM